MLNYMCQTYHPPPLTVTRYSLPSKAKTHVTPCKLTNQPHPHHPPCPVCHHYNIRTTQPSISWTDNASQIYFNLKIPLQNPSTQTSSHYFNLLLFAAIRTVLGNQLSHPTRTKGVADQLRGKDVLM